MLFFCCYKFTYYISFQRVVLMECSNVTNRQLNEKFNVPAYVIINIIIIVLYWKYCIFTCVTRGESRPRSWVTPSVCPSQNLVIATPLKLLIRFYWNLVCRYDIIWCYAYRQGILISSFLWELGPLELRKYLWMALSLQLLWNYWSIYHETWYVDRTSYGVVHVGREFWSPHFCGSYAPWNLENIRKSTSNLSFLCQFFINEITASDAGPDIIRSHLFQVEMILYCNNSLRTF